jgi:nucleotide-binding universal stress UspA family protein
MEIKKILWPTDLSRNSASALGLVKDLSRQFGAEVHLLYVAEDVKRFDHIYGEANPKFLEEFQEKEDRRAREWMERACQEQLEGCPAFFQHIVRGDPARRILEQAGETGADLIVMATFGHGRGGDEPAFFGSVVNKVVKHAAVPVLTVNPAGPGAYPHGTPGMPKDAEGS